MGQDKSQVEELCNSNLQLLIKNLLIYIVKVINQHLFRFTEEGLPN